MIDGRVPGLSLADRLADHGADFLAGREWAYGLFTPDERTIVGGCGLYPRIGPGAIELGYWLATGATGHGFATEAAAELTCLALASVAITRVEIWCDPRNVASMRIPERLGYRFNGNITLEADPLQTLAVWEKDRA